MRAVQRMPDAPDLRAMRKRLGWTQAQLAAALGVTRQTIIEREKGKVPISRETLLAMEYVSERPQEFER